MPGTLHPVATIIGMMLLPERPNLRRILSIINATLDIQPISSKIESNNENVSAILDLEDLKSLHNLLTRYKETQLTDKEKEVVEAYRNLVKRNLITWKSDDRDYGDPDFVKIYKGDDAFYITFVRQSKHLHIGTSVRFRNSGSSYQPFNMSFMRLFNKLQEYDPDYHQIHMEELNVKKLTK